MIRLPHAARRLTSWPLLACIVLLATQPAAAQDARRPFAVYLDCNGVACDDAFVRSEITAVDWVRDRASAQVHILATAAPTGGGGDQVTLVFLGQDRFAGVSDTLSWFDAQGASADERRRDLVQTITLGLVRYLVRTDAARRITVSIAAPSTTSAVAAADPWNGWLMSINTSGSTSREESSSTLFVSGTLSADRVTEGAKTSLAVNELYSESAFTIDGARSAFIQRNYGASLLHVISVTGRLSVGLKGGLTSSTFLNERLAVRLTPAIEYDLFPYAEATRRQVRLQYGIGASAFSYYDTTLYDKTREILPIQTATLAMSRLEPWGSLNGGIDATSYLSDLARRRVSYAAGASVRIVKGLSLTVSGNYDSVHDQFYIPKDPASRDATLLRQTQLSTRFSQSIFFGFVYSFGSVLNNVVNPRFGSGGAMIMMVQ
jgi:hypothetical protein